jgi:hypothetical protein
VGLTTTTRKPILLLRSAGWLLLRYTARALSLLLIHEPPRRCVAANPTSCLAPCIIRQPASNVKKQKKFGCAQSGAGGWCIRTCAPHSLRAPPQPEIRASLRRGTHHYHPKTDIVAADGGMGAVVAKHGPRADTAAEPRAAPQDTS